ncbi:hypothetical protein IKF92_01725 [Candidatus Saccharibacteria bacterium]|nr:hypothetical protein [Candidatus Saccharibacteria bacterium]
MDNSVNNYEQQFMQNVKTTPQPTTPTEKKPIQPNLILMIVLIIVLVLQSVLLAIMLIKFNSLVESDYTEYPEETEETDEGPDLYQYDDNNLLVSVDIKCDSEDSSAYIFKSNNKYEKLNSASEIIDEGKYSIQQDIAFRLSGDDGLTTLFFDYATLTDGTTFYACGPRTSGE